VDFSGASGAPLLVAGIGIGEGQSKGPFAFSTVQAGGQAFTILTLSSGKAPDVRAQGDSVIAGGQTIRFDGQRIVLGR
jgi:hypothetical protein